MKFKERLVAYKKIQEDKKSGKWNYIPFVSLPRLSAIVPGIIKGVGYLLGASSGVGKSQLARFLFIEEPLAFLKKYPDSGLSVKIIFNALEETEDEILDILIARRMKTEYNIDISVMELNGNDAHYVPDHILTKIAECEDYFSELSKHLEIVDIGNTYGFYKHVREYARRNGKFYRHGVEVVIPEGADWSKHNWDSYTPNNPNEIVIVISDHIWLYSANTGQGESKYQTLENFSAQYCRRIMNNKFGYATVNIQQFFVASEMQQFDNKGKTIVAKIEPSIESFGDIKILIRDHLVVFGLFSPARHNLEEYRGYDINKLDDNFRGLFILKNRKGKGENKFIPLYFDGAINKFEELPKPDDITEINKFYQ